MEKQKLLFFSTICHVLKTCSIIENNDDLFDLLTNFLNPQPALNTGDVGKYMTGDKNLPVKDIKTYNSFGNEKLSTQFNAILRDKLSPVSHKVFVSSIIDIIRKDDTIDDDASIGFPGYLTKKHFLDNSKFKIDVGELFANVFYYSINVDSTSHKDAIKDFRKTTYQDFESLKDLFELELSFGGNVATSPLTTTVDIDSFNSAFDEIPYTSTSSLKDMDIKLYSLKIKNAKFDLTQLTLFIEKNISKYLFSQLEGEKYLKPENQGRELYDALKKVYAHKAKSHDQFSEIMIYSFLEGVQKAPKILNAIDMKNTAKKNMYSTGIHLLVDPKGIKNKLLLGSSSLDGNINLAVKSAFNQVTEIQKNVDDVISLVDVNTLNTRFEKDTANYLKEILIPTPTKRSPSTSFGIFIGYTIKLSSSSLSEDEYENEIKEKMKTDIQNVLSLIEAEIITRKLNGYSFYFYFLPLDDVFSDATKVIDDFKLHEDKQV